MLKKVDLKAFKSFVDNTVELGNLTVLTGLNSSGKSTVIQAIRMVERLCRKNKHLLPGYGDFRELTNDRCEPGSMKITIEDYDGNKYEFGENVRNQGDVDKFPKLIYISAARFGPKVNITWYHTNSDMTKEGDNIVKCIDDNSSKIMKHEVIPDNAEADTFIFVLREWMKIISPNTKFDYERYTKSDTSVTTFDGHRSKNVGFGLSYTLPVITALLLGTMNENTIVVIENPEAHLHARAQTEIAFLIARCVEAGAQVVVETHSDHLVDGLRIYIKEHPGFEKKMRCYWFEQNEDKDTEPIEIRLNERGRILNVEIPANFMDQFEYNSHRLLFGNEPPKYPLTGFADKDDRRMEYLKLREKETYKP